jgi:hypothetical protein
VKQLEGLKRRLVEKSKGESSIWNLLEEAE